MALNFPVNPATNDTYISPDGKTYSFDGVKWVFNPHGISTNTAIGATPPDTAVDGDLWWDSTNGTLFVYYTDVTGSQWVSAVPVGDSSGLPDQSGADGKYLRTDGTSVYWGWATMPGITAPTVTVTGTEVSGVTGYRGDEIITITGSAFSVNEGEDVHAATDWRIVRDSDGATVWESLDDAVNLTTVDIPAGTVSLDSTAYVRHRGENFGYSEWSTLSIDIAFLATGGTVTTEGGYVYHTFTVSGTFQVISGSKECDVIIVAGGGGGGNYSGAGGGGVLKNVVNEEGNNLDRPEFYTNTYAVTVGGGGATFANGSDTTLGTLVAFGGGHGTNNGGIPVDGGCGGGAAMRTRPLSVSPRQGYGTPPQGFDGGQAVGIVYDGSYKYAGAGGGGAGGPGGDVTMTHAGNGGIGRASSISGELKYYAGGGTGLANGVIAGVPGLGQGAPNSGGGGNFQEVGDSGIVIIRYAV